MDLLCDLWPCLRKRKDRLNCVIVMRNLCFYGPSKAALASNGESLTVRLLCDYCMIEKVIDIFVQCLKTEEMKFVKAIAAGIQSLLYNCSKVWGDGEERGGEGERREIKKEIKDIFSLDKSFTQKQNITPRAL